MAFAKREEPGRVERKRRGKVLGIGGLALLFGSGLSLRLVPSEWVIFMMVAMGAAVAILVVSYLMVR